MLQIVVQVLMLFNLAGRVFHWPASNNYFYKCFYDPDDRSQEVAGWRAKLIYPTVNWSQANATAYTQDYINKILVNMKNTFKADNLFVNLYVHKPNSSCITQEESVATNLLYAQTLEPTIVKSYSLCGDDYSTSLSKMNTNSLTITQKDYSIGNIDRTKVTGVYLIRSGVKTKLTASDYDLSTAIGKIYFNNQLQTGDQFEIEYYE